MSKLTPKELCWLLLVMLSCLTSLLFSPRILPYGMRSNEENRH